MKPHAAQRRSPASTRSEPKTPRLPPLSFAPRPVGPRPTDPRTRHPDRRRPNDGRVTNDPVLRAAAVSSEPTPAHNPFLRDAPETPLHTTKVDQHRLLIVASSSRPPLNEKSVQSKHQSDTRLCRTVPPAAVIRPARTRSRGFVLGIITDPA